MKKENRIVYITDDNQTFFTQEEAEKHEKELGVEKYEVEFYLSGHYCVYVEANSESNALEQADTMMYPEDICWEIEDSYVRKIEE